ncbi:TPA: hypothetical protein ACH4ZD_000216 [Escherichia coli]
MLLEKEFREEARIVLPDVQISFERLNNGDALKLILNWDYKGEPFNYQWIVNVNDHAKDPDGVGAVIHLCKTQKERLEQGKDNATPR